MRPRIGMMLLFALAASCSTGSKEGSIESSSLPIGRWTDVSIDHSNVAELASAETLARIEVDSGDTRVTIYPDRTWPVRNAFLGFDKFFYGADVTTNPVVRVIDEGCDEPVVRGEACGWNLGFDGCMADGFGCFASLTNADAAGHGGQTSPLVFVLAGYADFQANDHGARFALHGRFGDIQGAGCSGFFSDGVTSSVTSDPGCVPVTPPASCTLAINPATIRLERNGSAEAVIRVEAEGTATPVTLSVGPSPLPPGFAVTLVPNPVVPPGDSTLGIHVGSTAPFGEVTLTIHGSTGDDGAACDTALVVNVVESPKQPCGCFD